MWSSLSVTCDRWWFSFDFKRTWWRLSRNASCALNLISTFLLCIINFLIGFKSTQYPHCSDCVVYCTWQIQAHLSNTQFIYLLLGNQIWPVVIQFFTNKIPDVILFLRWYLVPFVTYKDGRLCVKFMQLAVSYSVFLVFKYL